LKIGINGRRMGSHGNEGANLTSVFLVI
jgi:hypothetical protein